MADLRRDFDDLKEAVGDSLASEYEAGARDQRAAHGVPEPDSDLPPHTPPGWRPPEGWRRIRDNFWAPPVIALIAGFIRGYRRARERWRYVAAFILAVGAAWVVTLPEQPRDDAAPPATQTRATPSAPARPPSSPPPTATTAGPTPSATRSSTQPPKTPEPGETTSAPDRSVPVSNPSPTPPPAQAAPTQTAPTREPPERSKPPPVTTPPDTMQPTPSRTPPRPRRSCTLKVQAGEQLKVCVRIELSDR